MVVVHKIEWLKGEDVIKTVVSVIEDYQGAAVRVGGVCCYRGVVPYQLLLIMGKMYRPDLVVEDYLVVTGLGK